MLRVAFTILGILQSIVALEDHIPFNVDLQFPILIQPNGGKNTSNPYSSLFGKSILATPTDFGQKYEEDKCWNKLIIISFHNQPLCRITELTFKNKFIVDYRRCLQMCN